MHRLLLRRCFASITTPTIARAPVALVVNRQGVFDLERHGSWTDHSRDADYHPTSVVWVSNVFEEGRIAYLYKYLFKRDALIADIAAAEDELRRAFFPRVQIADILPSWKERGAYCFCVSDEMAQRAASSVRLKQPTQRIFMVQGTPFVEDYVRQWPSRTLLVEFRGRTRALSSEQLFFEMRQFGRLSSIDVDVSAQYRTARVVFESRAAAIAALKCLHLKPFGADTFTLYYEQERPLHAAIELLRASPRILALVIVLLFTVSTYLIITPLRNYFVLQSVAIGHRERAEALREAAATYVWQRTTVLEARLRALLHARPTSVTLVVGDRGTYKSSVFKKLLHRRLRSVIVDCADVTTADEFLLALERAIGFKPSFGALGALRSYVDAVATLGQASKAAQASLSNSKAAQLNDLLRTLRNALWTLSLEQYATTKHADDADGGADIYPAIVFDGFQALLAAAESDAQRVQMRELLEIVLRWADEQTSLGVAHVVFVSDHVYGEDRLLNVADLSGRVQRVAASDVAPADALDYLCARLPHDERAALARVVDVLGGRLRDLEAFVERRSQFTAARETPARTLAALVDDEERVVRLRGFGVVRYADKALGTASVASSSLSAELGWTQYQLWRTMCALADGARVDYESTLLAIFKGNEEAVRAMVEAELISVDRDSGGDGDGDGDDGKASSRLVVRPHSPLKTLVFRRLTQRDTDFYRGMEGMRLMVEIEKLGVDARAITDELVSLAKANSASSERATTLQRRLAALNRAQVKKEDELARLVYGQKSALKLRWM